MSIYVYFGGEQWRAILIPSRLATRINIVQYRSCPDRVVDFISPPKNVGETLCVMNSSELYDDMLTFVSHRYIVLTTSAGIMDHEEARRKHTGGKILGFFF